MRSALAAVVLAGVILASPARAQAAAEPDKGTAQGRAAAQLDAGDGGPRSHPDGGTPAADPDAEVIDHLDELEKLDLLENLELFDAAEEK